jgi:hypothetical protein
MSDDYLWDRSGKPDPDVARLEKLLAPLAHEAEWRAPPLAAGVSPPADPRAPRRRLPARRAWIAGGALALAAAIAIAVGVLQSRSDVPARQAQTSPPTGLASSSPSAPAAAQSPAQPAVQQAAAVNPCARQGGFGFEVTGAVTCDDVPTQAGTLPIGTWLKTAAGATVSLKVADIGAITVREQSELRILESGPREHRLQLMRGSLHAEVDAPPRLFVVDTRAAQAVDLGCAYDLSVDERGRSHLRVTSGAVSLEGKGRAAFVPRGAQVVADLDRGPGTVVAAGATAELRAAIERFDAGDASDAAALAEVVQRSTRADSVTLWSLLTGASQETRAVVFRRIEELGLRPVKVSRDSLIAGDPKAVSALRESFEKVWFRPSSSKAW